MDTSKINQFIRQHRQYGGIDIQIRKSTSKVVLVDVSQKQEKLSESELIEKAKDVFKGELSPAQALVIQVVEKKPSKYFYYQWNGKHFVQRVHNPECTFEIISGNNGYSFDYDGKVFSLVGEGDEKQLHQAAKWLKHHWIKKAL